LGDVFAGKCVHEKHQENSYGNVFINLFGREALLQIFEGILLVYECSCQGSLESCIDASRGYRKDCMTERSTCQRPSEYLIRAFWEKSHIRNKAPHMFDKEMEVSAVDGVDLCFGPDWGSGYK